jgi:peptidoglycan/xylan/chitin deacetylase (PgdA/CDA1 family)
MYTVSPRHFAEQMAALRAAGANVITVADLVESWEEQEVLPPRTTVVTFDDGRSEAMMWADPILQEAGFSATMFVIGAAVEEPGVFYATEDQLRSYAGSGRWDLQAHTYGSHVLHTTDDGDLPALTSLRPGESIEGYRHRIRRDLDDGDRIVREVSGRDPVGFAYPFGAHGTERANDPRIEEVLRSELAARYSVAFHQDDQDSLAANSCVDPRLDLRRLTVGDVGAREFLDRLEALWGRTEVPTRCTGGRPAARSPMGGGAEAPSHRGSTADVDRLSRLAATELAGGERPATLTGGAMGQSGARDPSAPGPTGLVLDPAHVQPDLARQVRQQQGAGSTQPPAAVAPQPAASRPPPVTTMPQPAPTTTVAPQPTTTTVPRPTTTTVPRPTTTLLPPPPPPTTTTTSPPIPTTTLCFRGNGNGRKPC